MTIPRLTFLNPVHNHPGTFDPGLFADMIEMGIQKKEFFPGCTVLKLYPGADARILRVPPDTRSIGCRREPENPGIQQFEPFFSVEDGGIFTLHFSIVASAPHIGIVIRKTPQQIVELGFEHLLHAYQVKVLVSDHVTNPRAPEPPSVSALLIGFVCISDVVRSNMEMLSPSDLTHKNNNK